MNPTENEEKFDPAENARRIVEENEMGISDEEIEKSANEYDPYDEPYDDILEQQEREDFAHDGDEYNMYPDGEGFYTNDPLEY